ncbi:MAG: nucleotidyl transferase AbiEii/AbiGii toxin family protein [Chloroflexota bacterium]
MIPLAFHGGTALRFLYSHGRFSEDLDFALDASNEAYNFRTYLQSVANELSPEGYKISLKINDQKTVNTAYIRFPGLLYELGLSQVKSEVLAIKIEVDTKAPKGAVLTTTVIRRFVLLQLQHHDKASLFAGKLHAVLMRPYLKGRDIFELFWYLSDPAWPAPNLEFLNNALIKTNWRGGILDEKNWKDKLRLRLRNLNWNNVQQDVQSFIEPGFDPKMLSLPTLEALLK